MRWFEHLRELVAGREPLVMVTLVAVRGHAPQEAGAKMLVTAGAAYGTIGGGNLEATAIGLARQMLAERALAPQMHTIRLTEQAPAAYGVQCCGGEVIVLLEPVVSQKPTVAIFGLGHVGLALAKVLSICPIALWLADSRAQMLAPERLAPLRHGQAEIKTFHAPILDGVVNDLPGGAHLVILTHDHAEDLFVLERALRRADLGYIGLIGSASKWARFRQKLAGQGFSEADFRRVTTPIGLPGAKSKAPEAIAIATAAQLLPHIFQGTPQTKPGREKVAE
ncbi:xanthine dehydrogenase accessory protein XdhC [Meiothermus cerbereus]|uniref:xanthine dehydrogenase accessory protein XdhC n=1 Tax=Meiothermus cerbereus TaxID=65552 RepID=UPI003EF067DC